jgi:hypothetical protein
LYMACAFIVLVCFSTYIFLLKIDFGLIDLNIFSLSILFYRVFGVDINEFLLWWESIGFSKLRLYDFALSDRDGRLVHLSNDSAYNFFIGIGIFSFE